MKDAIQDAIIEEFSMFDDWLDKYDYLISLADSLPVIDASKRTDRYIIEGCQSRVWVSAELVDGKMHYTADSDAIITKGIIALLIRVMDGRMPKEVADIDLYFIEAIGLGENLSPTRSNGLRAMIQQMKLDALIFTKQQEI
jgi:cysteine desulfuration protein SufE